jgi:hypothetical protein
MSETDSPHSPHSPHSPDSPLAPAILSEFADRGFSLSAEGDGIRVTPSSRLTAADRMVIRAHRAGLLACLRRPPVESVAVPPASSAPAAPLAGTDGESEQAPTPPQGVPLYYQDEHGRPTTAGSAYMWTWSGAPRWVYASRHAPPGDLR